MSGLALLALWLFVGLPVLNRRPEQAPQIKAERQSESAFKSEKDAKAGPHGLSSTDQEWSRKRSSEREDGGTRVLAHVPWTSTENHGHDAGSVHFGAADFHRLALAHPLDVALVRWRSARLTTTERAFAFIDGFNIDLHYRRR